MDNLATNFIRETLEEVGLQNNNITFCYTNQIFDMAFVYFEATSEDNDWIVCVFICGDKRIFLTKIGKGFEEQVDVRKEEIPVVINYCAMDQDGNKDFILYVGDEIAIADGPQRIGEFFHQSAKELRKKGFNIEEE